MNKVKEKIDLLSTMIVFHEDIERLDKDFHVIISSLATDIPEKTKERFTSLIQKDIVDHFKFEESIVFPVVKIWAKSVHDSRYHKIISGYLEAHKRLHGDAIHLQSAFDSLGNTVTTENISAMTTTFANFNSEMCAHAKDENEHIVSLLKENPTLRFLSSRKRLTGPR
jgi:hypothetical protein